MSCSAGADCLSVCCLSLLHPSSQAFLSHRHSHTQICIWEQAVFSQQQQTLYLRHAATWETPQITDWFWRKHVLMWRSCHGTGLDSVRFCYKNNPRWLLVFIFNLWLPKVVYFPIIFLGILPFFSRAVKNGHLEEKACGGRFAAKGPTWTWTRATALSLVAYGCLLSQVSWSRTHSHSILLGREFVSIKMKIIRCENTAP